MTRISAFVAVGAAGFVLQLGTIAALTRLAAWPYPLATLAGVELAVLHNFFWHQRWTWGERRTGNGVIQRLLRYHAGTAATSLGGNIVWTTLWVEAAGVDPAVANVFAVLMMSGANFLVADRWVFARKAGIATMAVVTLPALAAAQPGPDTESAWRERIAAVEARLGPMKRLAEPGEPIGDTERVPGGTIHRWRGATLVRGVTLDGLLHGLLHPGTPPPQDDVLEARVLRREGDALHVFLKLTRSAIVTVTYDTEHDVVFTRHGRNLATSRSVATRIVEVGGGDRGFLWRLNSYWRYVQVDEGVLVELESWTLSRSVPSLLRPVASPIITRIARESLLRTLAAMRLHFERT
jgi:putative flippase GtrA